MNATELQLEHNCRSWSNANPPGKSLMYKGIEVEIVSEAWVLGGHTAVVLVEYETGKLDTIALSHLLPIKKS